MCEVAEIKKINLEHSDLVKSSHFSLHLSKVERQQILTKHKELVTSKRSLLGRLLVLNNSDLNADVNADIDDTLEE